MGKACVHSKQFSINLAKRLFALAKHNHFHSLSMIDKSKIKNIEQRTMCNLICSIHFAEFYDLYQSEDCNKYDEALSVIQTLDIIPIKFINLQNHQNMNEILESHKSKVLKLDNNLRKYVGEICVAIMQIFYHQYQSLPHKGDENAFRISQKCRIIYTFFNMVESQIKPIGAGETAKQVSNLYFQTQR